MSEPAPGLAIHERDGRAHFAVRLIPRASRSALGGIRDGALVVRVTAAPVNGAANTALLAVLGNALRIGPTSIRLESGATASRKRLSVPRDAIERLRTLCSKARGHRDRRRDLRRRSLIRRRPLS